MTAESRHLTAAARKPYQKTKVEWAVEHALAGARIFPTHGVRGDRCTCGNTQCSHPGKHPISKGWCDTASCDPDLARKTWSAMSYANIARLLDHNIVLDVDPRHGGHESLEFLDKKVGGFPRTVMTLTGGFGAHLYFRRPEAWPFTKTHYDILPGVELKTGRSAATLPGSLHASGRMYEWIHAPGDTEMAVLPAGIVKMLPPEPKPVRRRAPLPRGSADANQRLADELLRRALQRSNSGRNEAGLWLSCQLRDNGFSQEQAKVIMADYAGSVHQSGHVYSLAEATSTLQWAYDQPAREPWGNVRSVPSWAGGLPHQQVVYSDPGRGVHDGR